MSEVERIERLITSLQHDLTDKMSEIERLREALRFYADPESYVAVAILADPPCGDFADDFSETEIGERPGRRARAALDD